MDNSIFIQNILTVINDHPEIQIVTLFGSAYKDRITSDSDVDIGVAAGHPLSFHEKNDLYVAFSKALRREIDLVDLQTVSGTILQQALCSGIVIKKNPLLLAQMLKKMWYNQADMMPLVKIILKKHCHRFAYG